MLAIRSHWGIEQDVHWVVDMSFDEATLREENAPEAMAITQQLALDLFKLQKNTMKRQSLKGLKLMAGSDPSILMAILTQKF